MGATTGIEWTGSTWNPLRARNTKTGKTGWHCVHKSDACRFCYAESLNVVYGTGLHYKPGHLANGDIELFLDEKVLLQPLSWRKPRPIFPCSMTDLFANFITDAWRDRMLAVMALKLDHTYQVLTKRPEIAAEYFKGDWAARVLALVDELKPSDLWNGSVVQARHELRDGRPLPNLWLGTSAGDQDEADENIPHLLGTPAAKRFVSLEPLIGPIDLKDVANDGDTYLDALTGHSAAEMDDPISDPKWRNGIPALDWVIAGGESGRSARPVHPDWVRALRDQCAAAGVPYFFKQWGEWQPHAEGSRPTEQFNGRRELDRAYTAYRVGKKKAGAVLDGVEHRGMPT